LRHSSNRQAGGSPLVRYPWLIVRIIRSFSICNPRTRRAVVTGTYITCTLHEILLEYVNQGEWVGGHVARMGEMRNAYKILF
jgi:hypothetical protein